MAERPTPYSIAVSITICTLVDPTSPLYQVLDPTSVLHQHLSAFLQDCVLLDLPSFHNSSSNSDDDNDNDNVVNRQRGGWSSIQALSLTQFLEQLQAIDASNETNTNSNSNSNSNDHNSIYRNVLDVLLEIASSMDSLLDCMESLRRAFLEGLVDETSAHGIYLRKVCLGFDQLSFETVAILWSELQMELDMAQQKNLITRGKGTATLSRHSDISTTTNSSTGKNDDASVQWPLSAAQMERVLRKECFRVHDIGSTSSPSSDSDNNNDDTNYNVRVNNTDNKTEESFEEVEIKLRKVLRHNPELPAAHFLRFLNCIKHGERVGALDALHQYFDYAIISNSSGKTQDILQYAAILLSSLYNSFGNTALARMATNEAVRVAQQSMDAACVAFALGWIFSNEQGQKIMGGSVNTVGMDLSLNPGDLLKRCASRAMEGHLRPLAAGANLSLARYYLSGRSVPVASNVTLGTSTTTRSRSGGLAQLAWSSVADATSTEATDDGAVDRPTHMTDIANSRDVLETLARQQLISAGIWDYFGQTNLSGLSSFLALYCHADKMLSDDVVAAIQNIARVSLFGSTSMLLSQNFSGGVLESYITSRESQNNKTNASDCVYSEALLKLASLWKLFRLPMDGVFLLSSSLILHEWAIRRGELHQACAFGIALESYVHPRLSNYWQVMIDIMSQKSLLFARQGKWAKAKQLIREMIEVAREHDLRSQHASLLLQLSVIQLEANPHQFTGVLPSLLECLSMTDKFEMDGLHATALSVLAQVHLRMRNPNRAIALLQASLPSLLQREHVWYQGDAFLTLAKSRLQLAKNVNDNLKKGPNSKGLIALMRSAAKDLQRSQDCFQKCQDCIKLREVFYLQARVFNAIPGEMPQRDKASQAFVDISQHVASANQPSSADTGVVDCLSSMATLERMCHRDVPITVVS